VREFRQEAVDGFEGGNKVRENKQEPVNEFEEKRSTSSDLMIPSSPEEAFGNVTRFQVY